MPKIHNLDAIPKKFVDDPQFKSAMSTKYLGALAGSERIYVNIDYVKPGAKSAKYHSHTLQEEFFLILKGNGRIRIQNEIFPVKQGDFVAKPAGKNISHQFINDGDVVLEILDCGTRDRNDIVEYPDESMLYVKARNAVFDLKTDAVEWSVDPNE